MTENQIFKGYKKRRTAIPRSWIEKVRVIVDCPGAKWVTTESGAIYNDIDNVLDSSPKKKNGKQSKGGDQEKNDPKEEPEPQSDYETQDKNDSEEQSCPEGKKEPENENAPKDENDPQKQEGDKT